jgi:hypothetical protein
MDYVDNGNLHALLQNQSITVSHQQLIAIAKQIATGMLFLTTYQDESLRIHDNFKVIFVGERERVKDNILIWIL